MRKRFLYSIVIFSLLFPYVTLAQKDSSKIFRNRKIFLLGSSSVVSAGSLAYLYSVWFSQYNTGKFHFFDDSKEWLQMDKCGHVLTNFQISNLMMKSFKWAGYNKKQSVFIGGTIGITYMTLIEAMDGMSSGWGFSWSDMGANTLGTALSMSQELAWSEQRINLKFSYHPTDFPKHRPELLGKNSTENILKDYNGQTYWLSISPFAFFSKDRKLPRWLAVSIGYGADGMLGAFYNNVAVIDEQGNVTNYSRERQMYASLDVDLSKINTKNKFLRALFNTINIVKIPAPTIEWQNGKTKFYYFYF